MKQQKNLLTLIPSILLFFPGFLSADPPEDKNAWTSAPHGWHLGQLGPGTTEVDTASYSRTVHVSTDTGNDRRADGSSKRPYATLNAALQAAKEQLKADDSIAILVAAGTHTGTPFALQDGIHLFGGFNPDDWTRDIHANETVLDARGQSRVIIGADHSTIDGFTITGGRVVGHGAGLYCKQTSPVVTNNRFTKNHAVEPGDFSHDPNRRRQRGHDGGAIGLVNYANPTIMNNLFINNSTGVGYGAAISARDDCLPRIGYNVFWGNVAGTQDHAITRSSNGGAIGLLNSSRAGIMHNLFVNNEAQGGSDGGVIFCEYFSWPEIRWNVFLNNYAGDDGGAIDSQKYSHPKIKYNLFYGNRVDGSGGALHHDDSLMELENNIFAYNAAQSHAGAFGGSHGWIRAVNNTVVYNSVSHEKTGGGAVHHYNTKNPYLKPVFFRNNIFYGNEPDELFLENGGDVFHNIIQGDFGASYGAYDMDPRFEPNDIQFEGVGTAFDPSSFRTRIQIRGTGHLEPGSLKNRIIRLKEPLPVKVRVERRSQEIAEGQSVLTVEDGTQGEAEQYAEVQKSWWSLVTDNGPGWIEVWGNLKLNDPLSMEVIPTFHLSPDSPAINNGVYSDYAADDIDGQPRYTPTIDFGADEYVPDDQ